MSRKEGWEAALFNEVAAARHRAFEWSVFDCATWAFDVRYALTGIDTAVTWRGKYRNLAGGLRVLKRLGHKGYADLADAKIGPRVHVLSAQRGDIVLVGNPDAFGVCLGGTVATVAEGGLVIVPRSSVTVAWRV
jgi:hypothetical protein